MKNLQTMVANCCQPNDIPYTLSQPLAEAADNSVHLLGFGFDGTACFRKGTRLGPNALRVVSDDIESYSPYLDRDLEDINYTDLGDLILDEGLAQNNNVQTNSADLDSTEQNTAEIEKQWHKGTEGLYQISKQVLGQDGKMLVLGGEHSISYGVIKAHLEQFPEMVLLHLDAHADLRDGYLGYHFSHASIIRRALDHFSEDNQLIQYGIRSGTKDEYQWMNANQTLVKSRETFLQQVQAIDDQRPIYLTLDLDYFDPGIFPGTGTPEPGGEDFHSFISLLKILRNKNFVGADVVELSPPLDSSGNSDVFATKVVRELLLTLA